MSRPACAPRVRAVAWPSSCRIKWPTVVSGKLVRLLQAWEAPPLPVHLVTKGRAHRAPKIDAFVEFAAQRLKALPVLLSTD